MEKEGSRMPLILILQVLLEIAKVAALILVILACLKYLGW